MQYVWKYQYLGQTLDLYVLEYPGATKHERQNQCFLMLFKNNWFY